MAAARLSVGIDLGGTATQVALVDEEGMLVDRVSMATPEFDTERACAAFSERIARFVREARNDPADVEAVGVAIPGTVSGVGVELIPNVSLDFQLLLECLHDSFPSAELSYLNDANAAALAEARRGRGQGVQSMLFVTLGTGIGAGYVLGGRLVEGANGAVGEIGHIKVVKGGRRCNCGGRGCLEQYASARGIVRSFREADANVPSVYAALGSDPRPDPTGLSPKHESDSLTVLKAYEKGDHRAVRAVDLLAKTLGFALAQATALLDPELVLLGGGVANGAPLFFPALVEYYRANAIKPCRYTEIGRARLGNDAGCLGAALHARERAL